MPFAAFPAKAFFYSDNFGYGFCGNIINHRAVFIAVGRHMAAAGTALRDVVHINNFIGVMTSWAEAATLKRGLMSRNNFLCHS